MIIVDTGFWVALLNGKDRYHQSAQETHLNRINFLIEKNQNLPIDLADASLVILAEELGEGRILSVDDRDFNAYRWKNTKPFQNLFDRL